MVASRETVNFGHYPSRGFHRNMENIVFDAAFYGISIL
jgi:hypothetical protein